MKIKRLLCTMLVCASVLGCITGHAGAVRMNDDISVEFVTVQGIARALGEFEVTLPAKTKGVAGNSFHLDAGETVRIKAEYSPEASVDFGLLDEDGTFHYINVTNGKIDRTIRVGKRGYYTLQIRNNSSETVKVSGRVEY